MSSDLSGFTPSHQLLNVLSLSGASSALIRFCFCWLFLQHLGVVLTEALILLWQPLPIAQLKFSFSTYLRGGGIAFVSVTLVSSVIAFSPVASLLRIFSVRFST